MFQTFAWIAVGFVGIVILILLNRRRRPSLAKAYEAYDKLTRRAGPEFEQLSHVFDRVREVVGEREAFRQRGLTGDSAKLGELILQQVDGLEAMSAELHRVLSEGDALLHPAGPLAQAANMTSTSRYLHCLNLLNGPSLQIDRFPGLDDMPGSSWVSFDGFFSLMHQRRVETQQNVDRFKMDLTTMSDSVSELESRLETLDRHVSRIRQSTAQADSMSMHSRYSSRPESGFALPAIIDELFARLENETQELMSDSVRDPIGIRNEKLPELRQKIDDTTRMVSVVGDAAQDLLPEMVRTKKHLSSKGYSTRWIDRRQRELEDEAERVFKQALSKPITELSNAFEASVKSFSIQVTQSGELTERLEGPIRSSIDSSKDDTKAARETIAQRLGISSTMALRESDYSPDDEIKRAEQQWLAAKASINRGDISGVGSAIGEIEVETSEIEKLIAGTLHALDEFAGKHELLKGSAESLKQRVSQLEGTMQSLKQRYEPDAFVVDADRDNPFLFQVEEVSVASVVNVDPGLTQGSADSLSVSEPLPAQLVAEVKAASLIDLLADAVAWMRGLVEQLDVAQRSFQSGKVLEACNQIDLVEIDLADLGNTLDRMGARLNHLHFLESKNASDWSTLATRMESLQSAARSTANPGQGGQAGDLTTRESAKALARLVDEFDKRESEQVVAGEINPVKQRRQIDHFLYAIDEILMLQKLEDESYQEVLDAVAGAEQELRVARQLVIHSHNDGIPDSVQIANDQKAVDVAAERLAAISKSLEENPTGFEAIDQQVTAIQVELSTINGRLRNELKAAKQAAASIQQAAQVVFQAAQWRGDYNIVVVGRPGSESLRAARMALAEGGYRESNLLAQEAERNAANGIVAAQAQVTRHRRMLARRAREARQFRERNNQW